MPPDGHARSLAKRENRLLHHVDARLPQEPSHSEVVHTL